MSFPDLTPTSTQSAITLPATGTAGDVQASLAISFYGADSAFQAVRQHKSPTHSKD